MKRNLLYLSIFLVFNSFLLLINARPEKNQKKNTNNKANNKKEQITSEKQGVKQIDPEIIKAVIEAMGDDQKQIIDLYMMEFMETMKKLEESEACKKAQECLGKYGIRMVIVPQVIFIDPSSLPKE
jgi:hypothetical protein